MLSSFKFVKIFNGSRGGQNNISQSEATVAISVDKSVRKRQNLLKKPSICFWSSNIIICSMVGKENKCSQSEAQAIIFVDGSARKK